MPYLPDYMYVQYCDGAIVRSLLLGILKTNNYPTFPPECDKETVT